MLVTTMARFDWDAAAPAWALRSVHPGHSTQGVLDNMDFAPQLPPHVDATPPPTAEELHMLRTVVRDKLMAVYPDFAGHSILQPA